MKTLIVRASLAAVEATIAALQTLQPAIGHALYVLQRRRSALAFEQMTIDQDQPA